MKNRIVAAYRELASACRSLAFDWKYRVNTRGLVEIPEMDIGSPNAKFGVGYLATHPNASRAVFEALPIDDFSKYTFIDVGSGKGRMLLRASEYPFHRIIGVEFALELHRIAQRNLQTYRNPRQRCSDIVLIHQDAAEFPIPEVDCVIYMFFPFEEPVMRTLLLNLDNSLDRNPRDVVLAYMNPRLDSLVRATRSMVVHAENPHINIYRSRQPHSC